MDETEREFTEEEACAIRKQAHAAYAVGSDNNIEIDSDANVVSSGEGGAWVAAWVYVPLGEE